MSSLKQLYKSYKRLLYTYPLVMQGVQTGMLMSVGDILAQTVVEKKNLLEIDCLRTVQFAAVGTFAVGPTVYSWYAFLNKLYGSGNAVSAVKKVATDQLVFAPIFIAAFIFTVTVTQTCSIDESLGKVKRDYKDILINNYKVWPLVQSCNFYLIPLHYQTVFVQSVAVVWNVYLSAKVNKTGDGKKNN